MRHFMLGAVFLAFSAFTVACISASPSFAQEASSETAPAEEQRTEPEDYVEPNWSNLARIYWALGMMDIDNAAHIDNFLLLTECEMYTTYKKNEMEWEDIREASKKSLIREAMKTPTIISVFIPLQLGQYNVEGEFFELKKAESGVDEARVIKTEYNRRNQGTCGKVGNIEGYPPNLILVLNRPFSLPRVPMERELAPLIDRLAIGGQNDVAVEDQAARMNALYDSGRAGREADEVAIFLDQGVGHAAFERKTRLFVHVANLAMHGHDQLWPQPAVKRRKLRLAGMAADMDMGLFLGDRQHVLGRELVHDPPDRDLIARDLLRREDDGVARFELDLVTVGRHARQRGAGFALPPRRDHHDLVSR